MPRRANPTRLVVNCIMLLAPTLVGAQQGARRARVDGVVRDSAGAGIRDAGVAVAGESAPRSVSDDSGAFHITSLSPGRTTFVARRLGFRPETLTVDVLDGRPTRADFTLHAVAVQLASELVTADSARQFKMGGFNKRRGRGIGVFMTREDI